MIVGGIFWSLAYFLIIRQGFKDRTYGMPLAALCANISWEAIFALQQVIAHLGAHPGAVYSFRRATIGNRRAQRRLRTAASYLHWHLRVERREDHRCHPRSPVQTVTL